MQALMKAIFKSHNEFGAQPKGDSRSCVLIWTGSSRGVFADEPEFAYGWCYDGTMEGKAWFGWNFNARGEISKGHYNSHRKYMDLHPSQSSIEAWYEMKLLQKETGASDKKQPTRRI